MEWLAYLFHLPEPDVTKDGDSEYPITFAAIDSVPMSSPKKISPLPLYSPLPILSFDDAFEFLIRSDRIQVLCE